MPKNIDYSHIHDKEMKQKCIQVRKNLPDFSDIFFEAKNDLSPATLYNYASDLVIFFEWAKERISMYSSIPVNKIPVDILDSLSGEDLTNYIMTYLSEYEHNGKVYTNDRKGKARKLASLRSFYEYYLMMGKIKTNPVSLVKLKYPADEPITYLQPNEVAQLLDYIDTGETLHGATSGKQDAWRKINRTRDLALLTLLLGTGIRVSECVGLNVSDIDFNDGSIHIIRKGHRADIVYMGKEVEETLMDYISNARNYYAPDDDNKEALFISLRHKRITVRSVEILVKKYVSAALPYLNKQKITPHKMRSTFGTNLYKETGDIKLVADALGHKNIATTQKHYAATDTTIKRSAFTGVRLRGDE